jgi:redox-sensitive bicupin YhaK (pirin superfamily)
VSGKRAVLFGDGDTVRVQTRSNGVRFLFLAARPIGEPIAWGGPIVMNTQEELDHAFREIDLGTFIRHQATPMAKENGGSL